MRAVLGLIAAALVGILAVLALMLHRLDTLEVRVPEPVMDKQWIREHEDGPESPVAKSLQRIYNEPLEEWLERWEELP